MTKEQEEQEISFRFSMFEQQIKQLQQQLQAIEQRIVELDSLNIGLDGLANGKGKEIFAPIRKGIFANANLVSDKLIVDIGEKTFVKKRHP